MSKINNLIINIIYFSYLILPLGLITGPLIPDFLISLSSILFIFYCVKNKEYKYFRSSFFYIFFIFYLWCIISALLSDYKQISFLKSLVYFRFFVFALSIWFICEAKKNIFKNLYFSVFLCFLILILDGYFQYFTGESITGSNHPVRISSFFGDELIYGSYLSRLMPTLIALFFLNEFSKYKKNQLFFSIFIIFTSVVIFLSGERAAFLFVILTFFYLTFMFNKYSKYLFVIFCIILLNVGIFTYKNEKLSQRMIDQTLEQTGISKGINNFSRNHKGHYLVAWDLFKNNKIFGVGPKNFWKSCVNNSKYQSLPYVCSNHPHNTYLQLLSETGLLGFFIIISMFIYLSYISIRYIYNKIFRLPTSMNFPSICITLALIVTLWPLISTGSFFNNYINIIYYFPVGIFLWSRNLKKS